MVALDLSGTTHLSADHNMALKSGFNRSTGSICMHVLTARTKLETVRKHLPRSSNELKNSRVSYRRNIRTLKFLRAPPSVDSGRLTDPATGRFRIRPAGYRSEKPGTGTETVRTDSGPGLEPAVQGRFRSGSDVLQNEGEVIVTGAHDDGGLIENGRDGDYCNKIGQQTSYGSGLEAMDLCEIVLGYWPCLDKIERQQRDHEQESRRDPWKLAANYLFGSPVFYVYENYHHL
ncbi:hypothetical protein F511_21626 [Dorcoceras hygrometricum]|uniref:Uncharacterized protein n=1 Tax=Dorcoceras hygrometricum TaxID=472368 RepID=A0A2Z7C1H2_9LAMI|nr:hypothetical protein F511_21626 [Dorcoceras hygrometricum]